MLCMAPAKGADTDQVLAHWAPDFQITSLEFTDARASVELSGGRSVLRIATGHQQSWPGVTLRALNGHWDLSSRAYVSLTVSNSGLKAVTINCRVDNHAVSFRKLVRICSPVFWLFSG